MAGEQSVPVRGCESNSRPGCALTSHWIKLRRPGRNWECSCCCPGKKEAQKERRATAFFRNKLAPLTYKLRWVLILFSFALVAGGVAVAVTEYSDVEEQAWVEGHPYKAMEAIRQDEFGAPDDSKVAIHFLYGMEDPPVVFPTSLDLFQKTEDGFDDRFVVKYASSPGFGPEQQEKMIVDCEALAANAQIVSGGESYCLLKELKTEVGSAFPYADEASLRTALEAFYASGRYAQLKQNHPNYAYYTGFVTDGDSGIKAIWQAFNSTMPTVRWRRWNELIPSGLLPAPCSVADHRGLSLGNPQVLRALEACL